MAAPTSTNEVTARKLSSSISALWAKIKSTFQPVADRVTSIRAASSATDTNYPTEKAVRTELDAKATDSAVLHKAGLETASGQKWFEGGFCVFNSGHVGYGHFTLAGATRGLAYNDWTEEQKDGAHFREWSLSFNTGVNFWGKLRITIATSYSSFNASGSMQKTINCAFSTNTVFNNTGYYNDLGINSEKEFRISDLIWNNTTECWEIKIHSIKPTSNNTVPVLLIEFWTYSTTNRESALGIHWVSTSPSIVTDTTYYTKRSGNASTSPGTGGEQFNWADTPVQQSPYGYEIFNRSHTIPVGNGGTGKTSVTAGSYVVGAGTSALVEKTPKDVGSDVLSSLDDKSNASSYANFVDGDFVVGSDHVDASTISASTFVRRTALNLWNYIKSKLTGSDVNIGGNAATAGTADAAKAFDDSFTGTNSIAYAIGLKQNLVAWDLGADTYNASTNRAATVDSIVKRIAVKPDGFSASVDYTNAVELSIPYSAGPGRVALMCVATTGNGDSVSFQATFVKNSNERIKFVVGTIMASTGTFVSPVLKFLSSDDSSPAQKVVLYIDENVRCNLSCLVAANDGMSSITVTEVARSTANNYSSLQSWGRLANDSGVVHIDGTETIIGAKEFSRPGQDTNFTDSSGAESIVRARTSSNSNNGSCQLNAYAGGGKFGLYARNASGAGKWVACLDNDGVVNLGSSGDAVRIGGTKFVFGASQLGTDSNTFYWV